MREAERIADLARKLALGWTERVEYSVRFKVHNTFCSGKGCTCPEVIEKRVNAITQEPLAVQLERAVSQGTGVADSNGGGKISKVDPELPGNFDAYDLVVKIRRDLEALVRQARVTLGYEAPQRILADTVCGNCGGALRVASDAQSDVKCAGTESEPPCGTVYKRWEWMELLKGAE